MTTLYLVRHGETDWNRSGRWQGHMDVPLNAVGRAQAKRLAHRLGVEGWRFDALYSSDLLRAWQTAQTLGAVIDLGPRPLPALREIDLGNWSGLTRAEIETRDSLTLARIDAGEDLARGGAERMADLAARVVAAVKSILGRHPGRRLLLITHGGPIRVLLMHADPRHRMTHAWAGQIGNTSVSVINVTEDGWQIMTVNDMKHLAGSSQAPDLRSILPDDVQQA